VLVSSAGALPGAAPFLRRLAAAGKTYLIVSNDASRLPVTTAARYGGFGLPIAVDQILTSGMLLPAHFAAAGLRGERMIVLGSADS
jgi:ribonucleotide monophosphatase NagD (HAD superfamily)